ncbi:hypothetical protein B7494_g5123 [Chlorociboria aeruginascens]|nr:hypothetical protein B7494_g5123 [Chlorociboria aeruginascens]
MTQTDEIDNLYLILLAMFKATLWLRTLELRKQSSRRMRSQRHGRNPIVDSPQYQAYRARQSREGNPDESKWPEVLENAFLDALLEIPAHMGRRKFSYQGKPHGRNELIAEYLWIAYLQSLPPGSQPDPTMRRGRKQVSSHIQVLKGFLKDSPAYERLFPGNKCPKNGFQDSFKENPCLVALSQGRLPNKRNDDSYGSSNISLGTAHEPLRPSLFWLLIASKSVDNVDGNGRFKSEDQLYLDGSILHKYSGLSMQRPRENLECIPNWRQKFPNLNDLYITNNLNCDLIHMDVSLELLPNHVPDGSELCTRLEMSMPGRESSRCRWQSVTSLTKPEDFYRDAALDVPLDATIFPMDILAIRETETCIKVPFPAEAWAHTFTSLTIMHQKFEEERKSQSYGSSKLGSSVRPTREYVDQITMYQELQSSSGRGMPFVRRAIIIWTFRKAKFSERGITSWRYLDPYPPRRLCMSPSPHSSHHVTASMAETYNSWADSTLHLHHSDILDPFVQDLVTPPPHTSTLQSPFLASNYPYPGHQFDLPDNHLSFVSTATADSESTLVDPDPASHIDNFLAGANVGMVEYDQTGSNWHLPPADAFDTDQTWAPYTVPSNSPGPLAWGEAGSKDHHSWQDISDGKQLAWPHGGSTKQAWPTPTVSPSKQRSFVEGSVDQPLEPRWIDRPIEDRLLEKIKDSYVDTASEREIPMQMSMPEATTGTATVKDTDWVVVEGGGGGWFRL